MLDNNLYLLPFATVLKLKGYLRGALYDLQRNNVEIVPNSLVDILNELEQKPLKEIIKEYSSQIDVIRSYLSFFKSKELVFETSNKQNFPSLSLEWDIPSVISNVIIDLNKTVITQQVINYLSSLNCQIIQYNIDSLNLISLLENDKFDYHRIRGVELVIRNLNKKLDSSVVQLICSNPRIINVVLLDYEYEIDNTRQYRIFRKLKSSEFAVNSKIGAVNTPLFTESQKHHTYFNRKLFIGINGEIKNAPNLKGNFGFIQDIENVEELKTIIGTPKFQEYWFVKKDDCDVCKNCEFKHMCIDNRVPIKRNENEWYHKEECNYNPYLAKWKGEEGFQSVADCGIVSNEKTFSIDHDRVKSINTALWDE